MKSYGCEGSVKGWHLFFYVGIVVVIVASIFMLTACDDSIPSSADEPTLDNIDNANQNTSGTTDNTTSGAADQVKVIFVLNNGEEDIECVAGDDIPSPSKKDCILDGWYLDSGLTEKLENAEDIAKMIERIAGTGTAQNEIRVYAKWNEKEEMTVRVKDALFCYDGNYHGIVFEGLPTGAKIEYEGESEYKNAGEYEIKGKITAEGYKDKEIAETLTITKATVNNDAIIFEDASYVWDGDEHSIEVDGELPTDITVTYEGNGQADVGEYEVNVIFDTHGNYEDIAGKSATLTIRERMYEVRFVEEGKEDVVISVGHGKGITDMPEPTPRRGYTAKWNEEGLDEILEDKVIRAVYDVVVYEIAYTLNGGRIKGEAVYGYTVEERVVLPDIEREHYIFIGWHDGKGIVTETVKGDIGDKTFSATWEAKKYAVEYDVCGGINDIRNAREYTVEDEDIVLNDAYRERYEFVRWADEEGNEVKKIYTALAKDMKLYAEWNAVKYRIRYVLNGGINAEDNKTSYTVLDEEIVLLDATREGYIFYGWYENEACAGDRVTKIYGERCEDIFLYAKWIEKYSIEYVLRGGENNENNRTSYTVLDEEVELWEPVRENYIFCGWYEDEECAGERVTKILGEWGRSVKLYAKWESVYEVEDGVLIGYSYANGREVVVPKEVEGERIVYIASGVLSEATRVEILAEIEEVNEDMFAGCSELEVLILPGSVGRMANGALRDCDMLKQLTIPFVGLEEKRGANGRYYPFAVLFGGEEKASCYAVEITPTVVSESGEDWSQDGIEPRYVPRSLSEVTVLRGEIPWSAFEGVSSVEKLTVCGEVIGRTAFRACAALSELIILGNVTEMNDTLVNGCTALRIVQVGNERIKEMVYNAVMQKAKLPNADSIVYIVTGEVVDEEQEPFALHI